MEDVDRKRLKGPNWYVDVRRLLDIGEVSRSGYRPGTGPGVETAPAP